MTTRSNLVVRYTAPQRFNHWVVAIAFVLLALSGLALFHPAMYWLANLFGGGPWTRILHPFIGVVMAAFFLVLAARLWHHNRMTDNDRKWLGKIGDVLANREQGLPEVGRYNAGQKMLFKTMVACMLLLFISGVVFWRPYFAPAFPLDMIRFAAVVHAAAAFVLIAGIIVHIYAAIWIKGTLGAMTRGTVTPAWAKKHHPGWYREIGGGS